jgi:NAD(P) transhydrogenase subunit beta
MPQLVSLFNAVGGGAAAVVALNAPVDVPTVLDVLIGALTFAGSLIAAGKLQGLVPGRPVVFAGLVSYGLVLLNTRLDVFGEAPAGAPNARPAPSR